MRKKHSQLSRGLLVHVDAILSCFILHIVHTMPTYLMTGFCPETATGFVQF